MKAVLSFFSRVWQMILRLLAWRPGRRAESQVDTEDDIEADYEAKRAAYIAAFMRRLLRDAALGDTENSTEDGTKGSIEGSTESNTEGNTEGGTEDGTMRNVLASLLSDASVGIPLDKNKDEENEEDVEDEEEEIEEEDKEDDEEEKQIFFQRLMTNSTEGMDLSVLLKIKKGLPTFISVIGERAVVICTEKKALRFFLNTLLHNDPSFVSCVGGYQPFKTFKYLDKESLSERDSSLLQLFSAFPSSMDSDESQSLSLRVNSPLTLPLKRGFVGLDFPVYSINAPFPLLLVQFDPLQEVPDFNTDDSDNDSDDNNSDNSNVSGDVNSRDGDSSDNTSNSNDDDDNLAWDISEDDEDHNGGDTESDNTTLEMDIISSINTMLSRIRAKVTEESNKTSTETDQPEISLEAEERDNSITADNSADSSDNNTTQEDKEDKENDESDEDNKDDEDNQLENQRKSHIIGRVLWSEEDIRKFFGHPEDEPFSDDLRHEALEYIRKLFWRYTMVLGHQLVTVHVLCKKGDKWHIVRTCDKIYSSFLFDPEGDKEIFQVIAGIFDSYWAKRLYLSLALVRPDDREKAEHLGRISQFWD